MRDGIFHKLALGTIGIEDVYHEPPIWVASMTEREMEGLGALMTHLCHAIVESKGKETKQDTLYTRRKRGYWLIALNKIGRKRKSRMDGLGRFAH